MPHGGERFSFGVKQLRVHLQKNRYSLLFDSSLLLIYLNMYEASLWMRQVLFRLQNSMFSCLLQGWVAYYPNLSKTLNYNQHFQISKSKLYAYCHITLCLQDLKSILHKGNEFFEQSKSPALISYLSTISFGKVSNFIETQ